jgi:hypothetical protein
MGDTNNGKAWGAWCETEEELPRYLIGTSINAMYVDESVTSRSFHDYQAICRACIPDAMDTISRSTFERSNAELAKPKDPQRISKQKKRSD